MSLCAKCREEWARWLDYREPAPIKIAQSGSPLHNVRHGARVIETIRRQQALIERACESNRHVASQRLWERLNAPREHLGREGWRIDCAECSGPLMGISSIDGRYCSPGCAGVTRAELDAMTAWAVATGKRCGCASKARFKSRYETYEAARQARLALVANVGHRFFDVYRCAQGFWHVGNTPPSRRRTK